MQPPKGAAVQVRAWLRVQGVRQGVLLHRDRDVQMPVCLRELRVAL